MNKLLKFSLRIIACSFTLSVYTVLIESYIHSYYTDFTFCVLNNVYGEFWFELIMFFIGSFLILVFYVIDTCRDLK